MKWAFVDYENTGSLEVIDLAKYQRVLVFLGPKNTKLKVGEISAPAFCALDLIAVGTNGPNNLDFHLAFHLGRFHETADPQIGFDIVSNDTGFNGLVNHVKSLGRKCQRVGTRPPDKPKATSKLSPCAMLVVERLAPMDGRKRPRTQAKLVNWIKSQCAKLLDARGSDKCYEELKQAGIVRQSGSDVTYDLKH